MYECWYCGSEVDGKVEYGENDRVVGYYHCPNCGSDYEFRQGQGME